LKLGKKILVYSILYLCAGLLVGGPVLSKEKKLAPGFEAGAHKKFTAVELEVNYKPDQGDSSRLAQELEFFDEFNLKVNFKKNSPGNFTLGVMDVVTFLSNAGKGGHPLYYVGVDIRRDLPLVVKKGSGVSGVKDLVGKKIGLPGLVTDEHLLVLKALKKANLSIKDIELVTAPNKKLPKLLNDDQVAAIVGHPPWILKPLVEGWGQEIIKLSDLFDPKIFRRMVSEVVVVSEKSKLVEVLEKTPDDKCFNDPLVRYLAALEKVAFSTTLKADNRIAGEYAKQTGLDEKALADLISKYDKRIIKRRLPMGSYIGAWIDEMVQLGMLKDTPDIRKLSRPKGAKWAGIVRRYGVQKW
jgi:ABC-type nitrate/sulfonate/bicarbonate transport system substrate-binding protein